MIFFPEKTFEAIDLNLGRHIQLHSGSNVWPHLFLFLCMAKNAKNGISAKTHESQELDIKPIYIWNEYTLGNVLTTCIWQHLFLCTCQAPQKYTNCTLAIQILGVTDKKRGMHTQIDFGSNMGGISPCYTTSHWCVKRKGATKKELLNKDWI